MVKSGVLSLQINDNIVLTDLAYEKANRLGMRLLYDQHEKPPAAPARPYLSQNQPAGVPPMGDRPATRVVQPPQVEEVDLRQRIRGAVIARLGNQVDSDLLDTIINRVLQSTGIK